MKQRYDSLKETMANPKIGDITGHGDCGTWGLLWNTYGAFASNKILNITDKSGIQLLSKKYKGNS